MSKSPDVDATHAEAVAREHRLTPKQRRFAEALAADPERNITAAALSAGSPRRGASSAGYALSRRPGVIAYIAALSTQAQRNALASQADSVMTLEEWLRTLTLLCRQDANEWLEFIEHDQASLPPVFALVGNKVNGREVIALEGRPVCFARCCCGRSHYVEGKGYIAPEPFDVDADFKIRLRDACRRGLGRQVSELGFDQNGRLKLKFVDKLNALQLLGNALGILDGGGKQDDTAQRQQREAWREALRDPDLRAAFNKISVRMERITITKER